MKIIKNLVTRAVVPVELDLTRLIMKSNNRSSNGNSARPPQRRDYRKTEQRSTPKLSEKEKKPVGWHRVCASAVVDPVTSLKS